MAPNQDSSGKQNVFPIAGIRAVSESDDLGLEQPNLLNPTVDDPDEFLEYYIDPVKVIALVLPRRVTARNGAEVVPAGSASAVREPRVTVRGAVSIQTYGLNRLGLVQARTRVLRHLEFLRYLIIEIDAVAEKLEHSVDQEARAAAPILDQLIKRVLAEITEMAKPDAPYSALVAQWRRRFLAQLDL